MKMKSSSKNMFLICCILIMILCTLSMAGCSSKSSIAGTWAKEEELKSDDYTGVYDMTFYEDGSCHDLPLSEPNSSAHAESYKIQEDGMLIITMEWGGDHRFQSTDDPDEALNDDDYYYLSGNTLIFGRDTYVRKDT